MAPKKGVRKSAAKKEEEDVVMEAAPESPAKTPASPAKTPASPAKEAPASPKKEEEAPASPKKEEPPAPPPKKFDVEWSAKQAEDKRPKTKATTAINALDCTLGLNVMENLVTPWEKDGFQWILSGGRGTTGVKSGRYLFEVRILDRDLPHHEKDWKTVRIGWGTEAAACVVGADPLSVGAEQDGGSWVGGIKKPSTHPIRKCTYNDPVFGCLVNLDKSSDNFNTVSIFVGGHRTGAPIPIPEGMHGKALFPMVSVRRASVAVHFGGAGARPWAELPFKACLLDDAAQADVVATPYQAPKDGKFSLVTLVTLPNGGCNDFLDHEFYPKETGKRYLEISKRAVGAALSHSGIPGDVIRGWNLTEYQNGSLLTAFGFLAAQKQRHIVLNVKHNLIANQRAQDSAVFSGSWFLKRAVVAVGAAPAALLKKVRAGVLDKKKDVQKKMVAAEKTAWEALNANKDPKPEEPNWAEKEKVDEEVVMKDFKWDTVGKPELDAAQVAPLFEQFSLPKEGPTAAAADERWLPEGQTFKKAEGGEGYDVHEFVFSNKAAATKAFDDYRKDLKLSEKTRVITPSEAFNEKLAAWNEAKSALQKRAAEYSAEKAKRAARKIADAKKAEEAEKAAAKKLEDEAKKAEEDAKKAEEAAKAAEEKKDEPMEEAKEGEEKKEEEKKEEAPASPKKEEAKDEPMEEKKEEPEEDPLDMTVDDTLVPKLTKSIDIQSVDGKSTPLFKDFQGEDWLILQGRAEMVILAAAFKADVTAKDSERKGMTPKLLEHYYQAYFKRHLYPSNFGSKDIDALLESCKDLLSVKDGVIVAAKDNLQVEAMVRTIETERRVRQEKVDAGDEAAKLTFTSHKKGKGKGGFGGPAKGGAPQPNGYAQQGQPYGQAQKRPYDQQNQGQYAHQQKRPAYGNPHQQGGYQQGGGYQQFHQQKGYGKGYGQKGYGGK